MACVPQLLAAVLAAASPTGADAGAGGRAIYTSPLPACDRLGLADEDGEVAALDIMRDGEPITPAAGFDTRDCAPPPDKAPAIVDCNDARAGRWVNEMVGTCDMPVMRPHASLRPVIPRDRARLPPPVLCAGASCTGDPIPLRTATAGGDDSPWMALESIAPPSVFPARPLDEPRAIAPLSVPLRRLLRPPIG